MGKNYSFYFIYLPRTNVEVISLVILLFNLSINLSINFKTFILFFYNLYHCFMLVAIAML